MSDIITVAVADDHIHFRNGLTFEINQHTRMQVIAGAANASELVEAAEIYQPDVIVTDLAMPGSGITAIRQLVARGFLRIVVLTGLEEEVLIVEALESGALGYVAKNADAEEIIEAILQVYRYRPHCSNSTSPLLMKEITQSSYNPYQKNSSFNFDKTELEIIRLTCLGHTIAEISRTVYVSPRKISRIKEKIIEETQVTGRNGLLFFALKTGIVSLHDLP